MARGLRLARRAETFGHAFRGLRDMLRNEYNARSHAVSTVVVVIAGLLADLDRYEWMAIVLTVAAVWSLEAVNTAIEAICDLVSPDHHEKVRLAKDVGAGAVLVAAIASVVVAGLVFGPRIASLLGD